MINTTPFLAGLNIQSLRRPARSLQQQIAEELEWRGASFPGKNWPKSSSGSRKTSMRPLGCGALFS